MFHLIAEMFTYPFMVRALCMGVLVALCAACTGAVTEGKVSSSVPEGWGEDFAAAQKAAAKADKFILVAFSG